MRRAEKNVILSSSIFAAAELRRIHDRMQLQKLVEASGGSEKPNKSGFSGGKGGRRAPLFRGDVHVWQYVN